MNKKDGKNEPLEKLLKEAHNEIKPQDSWEALRLRIERNIDDDGKVSSLITRGGGSAAFWRRLALALAACLVITTGLLIYVLDGSKSEQSGHPAAADQMLLSKSQMEQLNIAFTHVRELFGADCPWIVIGSSGEGEVGVDGQTQDAAERGKVVVIRLAVNFEGQKLKKQYFDVVTFSNQQVSFSVPVDDSDMGVLIKPILRSDGGIAIEISADINGSERAGDVVTIADNAFTSLVRIKSGSSLVDIDAVGRVVSNI
ncbi:MAG: hypothetical protein JW715_11000 [Sedimentisphaerales bacterium]|nr:hypothetical protein [Sedimentisphaerales bacterium]